MKRTKSQRTPTAILTADWHLREDVPICRKDDFLQEQSNKLTQIRKLQEKYNCPVLHAGDLFHHWKPSPSLLSLALEHLPNKMFVVYGNHDLPQHNLDLSYKSGVYTLSLAEALTVLSETHWGEEPEEGSIVFPGKAKAAIWHVMTYSGQAPFPGCSDLPAEDLLLKYRNYDLILTGHNHKPFVEQTHDRILVNPGSLTRQTADETHDPVVYLWYAENNTVRPVNLSDQPAGNVITREHIERQEDKQKRFEALINKLNGPAEEISFKSNLERHFSRHKTPKSVRNYIWEKYEGVYS